MVGHGRRKTLSESGKTVVCERGQEVETVVYSGEYNVSMARQKREDSRYILDSAVTRVVRC